MTTTDVRAERPDYLAHEWRVGMELCNRGWSVAPFGLGVFPSHIVAALKRTNSVMRYAPDLVAVRDGTVAFVDAKSGAAGRTAYPIALSTLEAARAFDAAGLGVVFVWPNMMANPAPDLLAELDTLDRGVWNGRGSGTPFVWWPVLRCKRFNAVFGGVS